MSEWFNQLADIMAKHQEALKDLESKRLAQAANLAIANKAITTQVKPAFHKVNSMVAGLQGAALIVKEDVKKDPWASLTLDFPRPRRPVFVIQTEALPDRVTVKMQLGDLPEGQRLPFPGGLDALTEENIIRQVLIWLEQTLDASVDLQEQELLTGTLIDYPV